MSDPASDGPLSRERQIQGAAVALKALLRDHDPVQPPDPVPARETLDRGTRGGTKSGAARGFLAHLGISAFFACLAWFAAGSSGGRFVTPQGTPPGFRSQADGSGAIQNRPVWPEKDTMIINPRIASSLLMTSVVLSGAALAGDATFLPSDTISIEGVPNIQNDFTIECRVWIPSNSVPIMDNPPTGYPGGAVFTAQRNSAMHTGLCVGPDGVWVKGTTAYYVSLATTMPTNQWCHIAVVRRGASMAVFVNGNQVGTIPCAASQQAIVQNADVRIGAPVQNGGGLPSKGFAGRIDWLRISAVARYTAPFTAPDEQALPLSDASTELLLRFNLCAIAF